MTLQNENHIKKENSNGLVIFLEKKSLTDELFSSNMPANHRGVVDDVVSALHELQHHHHLVIAGEVEISDHPTESHLSSLLLESHGSAASNRRQLGVIFSR